MAEFRDVAKAYKRLCDSQETCKDCVLEKLASNAVCCEVAIVKCPEEAERIVMQWAKTNPIKTNGMKFQEVFGQPYECLFEASIFALEWLHAEYKGGHDGEG